MPCIRPCFLLVGVARLWVICIVWASRMRSFAPTTVGKFLRFKKDLIAACWTLLARAQVSSLKILPSRLAKTPTISIGEDQRLCCPIACLSFENDTMYMLIQQGFISLSLIHSGYCSSLVARLFRRSCSWLPSMPLTRTAVRAVTSSTPLVPS